MSKEDRSASSLDGACGGEESESRKSLNEEKHKPGKRWPKKSWKKQKSEEKGLPKEKKVEDASQKIKTMPQKTKQRLQNKKQTVGKCKKIPQVSGSEERKSEASLHQQTESKWNKKTQVAGSKEEKSNASLHQQTGSKWNKKTQVAGSKEEKSNASLYQQTGSNWKKETQVAGSKEEKSNASLHQQTRGKWKKKTQVTGSEEKKSGASLHQQLAQTKTPTFQSKTYFAKLKSQQATAHEVLKEKSDAKHHKAKGYSHTPHGNSTFHKGSPYFTPHKVIDLRTLENSSPEEIQRSLIANISSLKMMIESRVGKEVSQDMLRLLSVLTKACSSGKSESISAILAALKGTPFLNVHLPAMLSEMQQESKTYRNEHEKKQVVSQMLSLCQTYLRYIPSAFYQLPLEAMQIHLGRLNIPGKSELEERLNVLKKERDELIQDRRSKTIKPCQNNANTKPPNNFREMQICPTVHELTSNEKPFLRENVTKGSYHDAEHYLDVQFRLYREDFITPLRIGIKEIANKVPRGDRDQNIKIYESVQIRTKDYTRNGIIYKLHFDVSKFHQTRWESSKRLIYGSFLCLSKDNFATMIFATVANREPKDLSRGFLDVRFVEGQNVFGIEQRKDDQYIMAESPAFFEAYRHVLAALQNMQEGTLPFKKYLVDCNPEVDPPSYLDDTSVYDLSQALGVPHVAEAKRVGLLKPEEWPDVEKLPLNDSQFEALKTALTKEFSVIQGPPGTGKTYVGLKITRCLLSNSKVWNPSKDSPILMVCFTNHALDQFLEGILDFLPNGIIRVGSRCKSERLEKFNLKHSVSTTYDQRKETKRKLQNHEGKIREIKRQLMQVQNSEILEIRLLENGKCILNEHLNNLYYSSCFDLDCKTLQDVFEFWICNKANERSQLDFNETETLKFKDQHQVPSQRADEEDWKLRAAGEDDTENWGEAPSSHKKGKSDNHSSVTSQIGNHNEDTATDEVTNEYFDCGKLSVEGSSYTIQESSVKHTSDTMRTVIKTSSGQSTSDMNCYPVSDKTNETDKEAHGEWTEVSRKKTVQTIPLPLSGDKNMKQEELEANAGTNIESNEISAFGNSQCIETIDIQQELNFDMQSRCIDGDEDRFEPIGKEESASNVEYSFDQSKQKDLEDFQRNHKPDCEDLASAAHNDTNQVNNKQRKKKQKKGRNQTKKTTLKTAITKMTTLTKMTDEEMKTIGNIWSIFGDVRLRLYLAWVELLKENLMRKVIQEEQAYEGLCKEIEINRGVEEEKILRKARVIGMTTTGAARYHTVLQRIKPRIVIVEEAAEVLEAHIITSLARDTKHVILIGDHKQLRPKPTVYNLALQYNLEISLFERMVLNSMDCKMLSIQHRMRPEIAVLTKSIYEPHAIQDDDSVTKFEDIRGLKTNLFFIDHRREESFNNGLHSYANDHEAEMLVSLCRYLLQQDYEPKHITILTLYTGQLLTLKKKMPRDEFEGVRASVVDNFQGEENDIILLSLVRSNRFGSIGFLKESNRICVALSRARKGFYCIGNFQLLSKIPLWRKICEDLRSKEALHESIQLVCKNHGNITEISKREDFSKVPSGGCGLPCDLRLLCGHLCPKRCHGNDPEHRGVNKCRKMCFSLCMQGLHRCQKVCHYPDECETCQTPVNKTFPKCGHDDIIACDITPRSTQHCNNSVPKTLRCGHQKKIPCFLDPLKDFQSNLHEIEDQYNSLRMRIRNLRIRYDRQTQDEEDELKECIAETSFLDNHRSTLLLNRSTYKSAYNCGKQCSLICNKEHKCTERCHFGKECKPCKAEVEYKIPKCGHRVKVECHMVDLASFEKNCEELCTEHRECGHKCKGKCGVDCSFYQCQEKCENQCEMGHPCEKRCHFGAACDECGNVVEKINPICNHTVPVKCHVDASTVPCFTPCERTRSCGHPCNGRCYEECDSTKCNYKELKTLPCGHQEELQCHVDPSAHICTKQVTITLPCNHELEIKCHLNLSQHLCQNQVTKELPCGHKSQQPCYINAMDIICQTSVTRNLPCGHSFITKCSKTDDRINCHEIVNKTLPCGHVKQTICCKDVQDVLCRDKVNKELPCKHFKRVKCHEDPNIIECHEKVTVTLDCNHTQCLPCSSSQNSYECDEREAKVLPCGHEMALACHEDAQTVQCDTAVIRKLPCGHETELPCNVDPLSYSCVSPCERYLPCNHQCKLICSAKCDPSICTKPTEKQVCLNKHMTTVPCNTSIQGFVCSNIITKHLNCGHTWSGECHKSDQPILCKVMIPRILRCPERHKKNVQCHVDIGAIPCDEQCSKTLQCGHPCPLYCDEPCYPSKCTAKKLKIFKQCGHKKQVPCAKYSKAICLFNCGRKRSDCNHPCQGRCGKPCNLKRPCLFKVPKKLPCGHTLKMKCCDPPTAVRCPFPCSEKFECGHVCSENCSTCQEKGEHKPCPLPCGRIFVCSHRCHGRCSDPCSPCSQECQGWCPHGTCRMTCSQVCNPCEMPCANICPHQKCSNLCHEMCDREPCNEPCPNNLICGHRCIGLCGESCPNLCYVCTPAKVAAISPNKQRKRALRFIQLQECGHIISVDEMDSWMKKPLGSVTEPRKCPKCSVPIYFSFRYANAVREALQNMFTLDLFKKADLLLGFRRR